MSVRLALLGAAAVAAACSGPAGGGSGGAQPTLSPVATAAGSEATSPAAAATPATTPEAPPHIMVIVLENREYDSVIGPAPRLTGLARAHGLATNAFSMTHPSEPNYLALITGSTQGITDDGNHLLPAASLAGQLQARGIGWRAYMGGLPGPCDPVVSSGLYAKKHDPFLMVREVVDSPSMCASVVPQSDLAGDLGSATAPAFMFVSPNLCADGHSCSTETADTVTANLVSRVVGTPWYAAGGVIVITWDEGTSSAGCCAGAQGGHIAVIVVSSALRPGTTLDSPLDHAGVLRGIEEAYSLPLLSGASCACSGDLLPLLRPGS